MFFTEMWERFSYYGMRGLLILYLTQHFLFSDEKSAVMYGAYTALVYVMTIIGGTLADRYLRTTQRRSHFGAILLCLGHFGMAFEGSGSKEYIVYQWRLKSSCSTKAVGDNRKLYVEVDGAERRVTFGTRMAASVSWKPLTQPMNRPRAFIRRLRRTIFHDPC